MQYAFLAFMILGALIASMGRYIERSQMIELLSQHSNKKSYNRPALAQFAGKNIIYMGLLALIISTVSFIILFVLPNIYLFYCLVVVIIVDFFFFSFRIALGVKRFEEKQ